MSYSLCLLATSCLLAPAPKEAQPALVPGSYLMTWRGVTAPTMFHANGSYACYWHGAWWQGQWRQTKGVLSVEEWPAGNPDHVALRWSVKLSSPATGDLGGTLWFVAPKKERVD